MSYMRRPRTTQEKRWSESHKEYIRSKRNKRNLADAWDDKCRSDIDNRSWKGSRKTQYKPRDSD